MRVAEHDPSRYGLDVEEVSRRRRVVDEVGKEVEEMRLELNKVVATRGPGAHLPDPAAFDDAHGHKDDGEGYEAWEQQRQVEMMHEQDEALDGVFRTVGNLREQADTMGRELEEQGEILGEVDGLADRVGGKLAGGMKKMNHIIRRNEGMSVLLGLWHSLTRLERWSSCCIAVLIFVLILLLILVIAL